MGRPLHFAIAFRLLGLVLVVLGMTLILQSERPAMPVSAGHGSPHSANASGIPYWPGAAQKTKNETYYTYEFGQAISRWNNATNPDYLLQTSDGTQMKQYMVYSGSQQDINYANLWEVNSCKDWTDQYSTIRNVRAFEYGHSGPLNGDKEYTVVCLNVSALGYPVPFDYVNQETRIKGISHEMGHSLHLAHDSVGTMCTCWAYNISGHDAASVYYIYVSPP
jgi:hypothetical protein